MTTLAAVPGGAKKTWSAALEAAYDNVGADPYAVWTNALDEAGSGTRGPDAAGEYTSNCPNPSHNGTGGDEKASLRWRQAPDGQVRFHCLSADTRVITRHGTKAISELAGGEWDLLVPGEGGSPAHWQRCPIRSFGVQSLVRITLTRNQLTKVVHATPEHRWFVEPRSGAARIEVVTKNLKVGSRLAPVRAQRNRVDPSPYGVAHGFVFGDGTLTPHSGAQAQFVGRKDEALLPYFPQATVLSYEDGWIKKVRGLPKAFKQLPSLDESASYLYGWLAGYFAADGHVSKATPVISSAVRENLEAVRDIANWLGIVTYPIREYEREGFGGGASKLYCVSFQSSDLTPEFFLHAHHRAMWDFGRARAHLGWKVVSVEETNLEEEVYCAVVEGAEAFALEDNLLTGNCQAGCDGEDITTALGITYVQLRWPRTEYTYRSELREVLAVHIKVPTAGGKKKYWWEHDENGTLVSGRGTGWEPVLWCLPDLIEATERARNDGQKVRLYLAEGEKDAITVAAAVENGWVPADERDWIALTTTSADGAATWTHELTAQVLALGVDAITVLCDSDESGARRGSAITEALIETDPTARVGSVSWAGREGCKDASDAIERFAAGWLREAVAADDADAYLWCSSETGWLFEADSLDLDNQPTGRKALHRMIKPGTKTATSEAITKWPMRVVASTVNEDGDAVGWELDLGPGGTRPIRAADLVGSAIEGWNSKIGLFVVPTRGVGPAIRAYLGYHGANSPVMAVWDHEGWVNSETFVTGSEILIGPAGLIGRAEAGVTEWHYGDAGEEEAARLCAELLTFRPLTESAPVLSWLAGVAARPHALEASGASFVPMLQVPGDSGTGKTSFLRLATRLFGLSGQAVSNVTTAGLVRTLALSTQPVWIDDFANYDDTVRDIIRGGLTGAGRTRGTTASERGIVRDEARAALVNSGETAMGLEERAMRQRSVVVPFTERAQGRKSRHGARGQYADMVEMGVDRDDRGSGLSRWAGSVVKGCWEASGRLRTASMNPDGSKEDRRLSGASDGVREAAAWRFVEYGSDVLAEWMRSNGVAADKVSKFVRVVRGVVDAEVRAAEEREKSGADIHLITTLVPAYLRARRQLFDTGTSGRLREGEELCAVSAVRIVRDAWRTADNAGAKRGIEADGRPARGVVLLIGPGDGDERGEEVVGIALSASSLAEWAQSEDGWRAGIGSDRRHVTREGVGMQVSAVSAKGPEWSAGGAGAGKMRIKLSAAQTPHYSVVTNPDVIKAVLGS